MAKVYQTPVCLPGMAALAVLSGAVGKSVVVRRAYKDKDTRLNSYVIGASERGTGKGIIAETLARPLTERSTHLAEHHKDIVASQRGELGILKKEISTLEGKAVNVTGPDRHEIEVALAQKHLRLEYLQREARCKRSLHCANATGPALAERLAHNHETLFSYSSEAGASLRTALGRFNDDGGGDFDLLLSAYSGDSVREDRIGREGATLVSPCMSLLWLVQGCVLRELLANSEAFDRGLTARPLIFATGTERQLDDRRNLSTTTLGSWRSFIDRILDRRLEREGQDPVALLATPRAREVFCDFHDESVELGRGAFADLDGELTRWRENSIKVAGLLAVAEDSETVTEDHARRACKIVRWAGYSYLGMLNAGRKERQREQLDRILEIVRAAGGRTTLRELERRNGIAKTTVAAVAAAFPDHLQIERAATGKAGRPSEIVSIPGAKSAKSDTIPPVDTAEGNNAEKADFAEGESA